MLNVKKCVYTIKYKYHLILSDYCYGKIDEWDADNIRYWGDKTAKHTKKCLETIAKLNKIEEV